MPRRKLSVARGAACGPLSILLVISCGGSSSTAPGSDGGGGASSGGGYGSSGAGGGSGGSSGVSGSGGGTGSGAGAPSTCIVGTQGCLCDSTGGCAPGLTCAPQGSPQPSLCCSGSNCAPTGGSIGSSCSTAGGAATCTPGIKTLAASGSNDGCGYAASSFTESTTLCAINAVGGGAQPAVIQVFYNDEHALTLGCATTAYPVSALPSDPAAVHYPQTGDPACADAVGRPLRPVLYVTDTTADPTCTAGDLQHGGHPYDPVAVFGSWKSATEGAGNVGTPATADPAKNTWNLTSSADAVPAAAMTCREGYGAELRFEVGLVSGHSYRFQVIVHDGDQNKGGDSGEACADFCAGSGSACPPGVMACGAGDAGTCLEGTVCSQGCCLTPDGGTVTPPVLVDGGVPPP